MTNIYFHSKWAPAGVFRNRHILQRGCRMGVKAGLSGVPLQPLDRPTWMSGWTQLQGSMTTSSLLR